MPVVGAAGAWLCDFGGRQGCDLGSSTLRRRPTVLGHSYGTTAIGYTAREPEGLDADDLILVASPGIGVWQASDLPTIAADHVWVTTHAFDIIHLPGQVFWNMIDPMDWPSARTSSPGDGSPTFPTSTPITGPTTTARTTCGAASPPSPPGTTAPSSNSPRATRGAPGARITGPASRSRACS
ncbi:alpha/beta hydrolase [Couchioplanes caeruleus]|uniref:alpha/beta hydrolase n=1 Tax=Couchioplanes caeruleus TaxID=56438 RepID=UPI0008FF6CD9